MTEQEAYEAGFRFAAENPDEKETGAKERGIGLDWGQPARVEWDRGFAHERCARRLGHDTVYMSKAGIEAPTILDPATVIMRLLDHIDALKLEAEAKGNTVANLIGRLNEPKDTITFRLNKSETAKARAFVDEHDRLHGPSPATAGERYVYTFVPSGIGTFSGVKCGSCGAECNLTDYEAL